jgi:hypothetical protein
MKYNSYYYKNEIKEKLKAITYDIDGMYNMLEDKLRDEIIQRQEEREASLKEANEIFKKMNDDICIKIIKDRLPWRVKLLNIIKYSGRGVTLSNRIEMGFTLNDNHSNRYSITVDLSDIEKYLE